VLVSFTLNGKPIEREVEPRLTLGDLLREKTEATGTHLGCEHGVCGSCTVIVDGLAIRSCLTLAVQVDGSIVTTVEGLAIDGELSALQASFKKHHALQCGFCTPGILTSMHALLLDNCEVEEDEIREVLSGNLCRCTGYIPIVEAVMDARETYRMKA
jgi:aerobic-type carbon monoxide dehydrogenase small subunit (CoxS/CutS family)